MTGQSRGHRRSNGPKDFLPASSEPKVEDQHRRVLQFKYHVFFFLCTPATPTVNAYLKRDQSVNKPVLPQCTLSQVDNDNNSEHIKENEGKLYLYLLFCFFLCSQLLFDTVEHFCWLANCLLSLSTAILVALLQAHIFMCVNAKRLSYRKTKIDPQKT